MQTYELDQIAIEYDVLSNSDKTYDFLKENTLKISIDYQDIIYYFNNKAFRELNKTRGYFMSPEWGTASKNFRFRFILIKIDDDYVYVPFKLNTPLYQSKESSSFYISGDLISYNDNQASLDKVLALLKQYECIKYMSICSDEDTKWDGHNNYYNTLESFSENFDKSAWRSKKGINKLSKIVTFESYDYYDDRVYYDIEKLCSLWCETKYGPNKKSSVKEDTGLISIMNKVDTITAFIFRYNDILVGYSIGVRIADDKILLESTKNLCVFDDTVLTNYVNEIQEGDLRNLKKHLGPYMQFTLNKHCLETYKGVYYDGDVGVKHLRDFKREYYKNIIYYKKVDLH